MSESKQEQDQLSALFSQRFKDRESTPTEQPAAEKAPRNTRQAVKGSSTQDGIVLSAAETSRAAR